MKTPGPNAPLSRSLLARPAHILAPELLGHVLVSGRGNAVVALRITEVEAYEGEIDPASHGWRGKTARNATMFGPPGHLYVYSIYGLHRAANIVCGTDGESHAVLVRAGEIVSGYAEAAGRRPAARSPKELAQGPGRLADALDITRAFDGVDLCDPRSAVRLVNGDPVEASRIMSGPRTGVSRAREIPWRFWISGDPTVSRYRQHVPRTEKSAGGNAV